MNDVRGLILNELRSCLKRGLNLPQRPDPSDLWAALDGDGAAVLLATLDFLDAAREVKQERAEAWSSRLPRAA